MDDFLRQPPVVAGIFALLGVLAAPVINAAIKRKENGRLAAIAAETLRMEATEKRLKELLDRQAEDIVELRQQLREKSAEVDAHDRQINVLERQAFKSAQKFDRVLTTVLGLTRQFSDDVEDDLEIEDTIDVAILRRLLRDQRERVLARRTHILDAIESARGGLFDGHEKSA